MKTESIIKYLEKTMLLAGSSMNNSETIYRSCLASLIEMLKVENEETKEGEE